MTAAAAVGLLIASCAGLPAAAPGGASTPTAIHVDTAAVLLNPRDPSQRAVGDFQYAGGLVLSSRDTDRLHGLSDIFVRDANWLTAVGDDGILFEARLLFEADNRLAGLAEARLMPLADRDGSALSGLAEADAEGLAPLESGGLLISFERLHRVWLYPAGGGWPRPAPAPAVALPANNGLEALAADPDAGPDAYVVGAEATGATWTCRLSQPACQAGPSVSKPREFGLVAMRRLPDESMAYLLRAHDEARGARVALEIHRAEVVVARLDLAGPLTVDNFEGVAVVPGPNRSVRFYLVSDDNSSADQRTLLLAFDWQLR